ncbi:MAG: lysozyme inhibitor LprI family protein [Flavobacteriales bacterium]
MKTFLLFMLTFLPSYLLAQIDFENPPWEIGCDTAVTQTDMNMCSGKMATIADSIMIELFKKNLKYYQKLVNEMDETPESDYPLEDEFRLTLTTLEQSQESFKKYRDSLCEFEAAKWAGGSITPLMVNGTFLSATVDRIKILEAEYEFNMNK